MVVLSAYVCKEKRWEGDSLRVSGGPWGQRQTVNAEMNLPPALLLFLTRGKEDSDTFVTLIRTI